MTGGKNTEFTERELREEQLAALFSFYTVDPVVVLLRLSRFLAALPDPVDCFIEPLKNWFQFHSLSTVQRRPCDSVACSPNGVALQGIPDDARSGAGDASPMVVSRVR